MKSYLFLSSDDLVSKVNLGGMFEVIGLCRKDYEAEVISVTIEVRVSCLFYLVLCSVCAWLNKMDYYTVFDSVP